MDRHTHGPDGEYIPVDADVVETATEAEAVTEVAKTTAEADVEIARIQAKRDEKLADKDLEREQLWQESRVAELEGRMRGMQEVLDRIVPPEPPAEAPAAETVVVEAPAEPKEEPTAPAPPTDAPPEPKGKKRKGFWDAYQ